MRRRIKYTNTIKRNVINVFISGFPRAGTTMLCLMMHSFKDCAVYSKEERHPQDFSKLRTDNKYLVLKQPFGVREFTPLYSYESLISDYKCKIISLVRDPRDVAVSIHAANPSRYWVSYEMILLNCEEYLKNLSNPNVLFIRYENLVSATEVEINRISEFLGCPHNDRFWDFYKHPHANLPKNNSLDEPRPIDTSLIGEWKKEKHKERINEITTTELTEYIKALGVRGIMMEPILEVIAALKQNLNLDGITTVLDLGCGSFYNRPMELFYKHDIAFNVFSGKQITGVDIFDKDILWRKKYGPIGDYVCMNILDFEIEKYYDVIICHHVLEHLTQSEHDIVFKHIDGADCKYIILGGPVGYSDNATFVEIKGNKYEEHRIGLIPKFYENNGYIISLFGPSFLAIKEKI